MSMNSSFARRIRLRRLYRHAPTRMFVVPLDHSISDGPITGGAGLDRLVGQLAGNGVDAVVLHKGSLRHVDPAWFARTSLIVHLSASTARATDPNAKYLVANVAESLRLGADAVSVHVNLGSLDEGRQVADLAAVSEACEQWNVPLLAMVYPRGPEVRNPRDPELVAHAVTLAVDLGADIVKTVAVDSVSTMADITRACPIPVILAGGPPVTSIGELRRYVGDAMRGGVAGLAMGRNIFQATDPGATARMVADLVHDDSDRIPALPHDELAVAAG
ncbi:MAG: 2-amino-4,5-dihydroxy-6-one-heptanoic acid-7-phosphate synthase [Streptosporangiales bacterium]|nr:2-amino-4,5-dihydroxy-6-one-heptanoic acid-7-phosphate synthase [Streptosporangiales bacterium]